MCRKLVIGLVGFVTLLVNYLVPSTPNISVGKTTRIVWSQVHLSLVLGKLLESFFPKCTW